MKKFTFLVVFCAAIAFAANVTITQVKLDTSVAVTGMAVKTLPDGGCAMAVQAQWRYEDAGTYNRDALPFVEVSGARQTACLNLISSGLVYYKIVKGF